MLIKALYRRPARMQVKLFKMNGVVFLYIHIHTESSGDYRMFNFFYIICCLVDFDIFFSYLVLRKSFGDN